MNAPIRGFETGRLRVAEWHVAVPDPDALARIIGSILDDETTRLLPPEWHGCYDTRRAREWVADRDREGTTLLAVDRTTAGPIGLVLIAGDDVLRLGYVIAAAASGRGFATELVCGLVERATRSGARSIEAGVGTEHAASIRVLEKAGFERVETGPSGDLVYRLRLAET